LRGRHGRGRLPFAAAALPPPAAAAAAALINRPSGAPNPVLHRSPPHRPSASHRPSPSLPTATPHPQVFDKENRGWISAAELRHVLTSIGEKLGPDEMDAMMAESDPDQDGKIQ